MNPDILLEAKNLHIGYEKTLLGPINFSLFKGDFICLMGINGSGKSTLFKTIASLIPPRSGEIIYQNQNLNKLLSKEKSKVMSFVFSKNTADENLKVCEVLKMGRYPYTNFWGQLQKNDFEKIGEISESLLLNSISEKKLFELSDGQKQKVWIARALVQDTPFIFLDEPTNFLDIPHRLEMMYLLQKVSREQKKIVLFSSHDWECARSMATSLWLIHDKKLYQGSPEDFILNGLLKSAFTKDSYSFDDEHGVFKEKKQGTQKLVLDVSQATPEMKKWTIHFLERMGYELSFIGEFQVKITEKNWSVQTSTGITPCASLEEVIKVLREYN